MTLLSILLCIFLERGFHLGTQLSRFNWYNDYKLKLSNLLSAKSQNWNSFQWLIYTVAPILIIVGGVYIVVIVWAPIWLKFLLSTSILYYCLGPNDFFKQNFPSPQTIYITSNQNLFAVLVWYVLLGPIMALAYRLISLEATPSVHDLNIPLSNLLTLRILRWMDWLPVRILSLLFALIGNFIPSFNFWIEKSFSGCEMNGQLLETCGDLAQSREKANNLIVSEKFQKKENSANDKIIISDSLPTEETIMETYRLIDRSLVIFIALVSLVTLGMSL